MKCTKEKCKEIKAGVNIGIAKLEISNTYCQRKPCNDKIKKNN